MITFFKIFFLFLLSLNLFASDNYIDSITLTKVKKLIQKEEEIALAYKEYILEKGEIPTSLSDLKTNNNLPAGFSSINTFGKEMRFDTSDTSKEYKLESSIPDNVDLKTNVFDYYYSNKYRVYTKAPLSIYNGKVEIKLSSKENFIYKISKTNPLTTTKTGANDQYYLDENAILLWYGNDGKYKFSINKDLIVDSSVDIFEADGVTVKDTFKTMVSDVTFAGQTILHKNSITNTADEYLGISDDSILKTSVAAKVSTELGLLQFGKQSGGMIVNGDIYTWGNNSNRITGINLDSYTGGTGGKKPVITTLVKVKAKVYEDDITDGKDLSKFYDRDYFSSPFRPKFVDLFANTKNGTCGITEQGALFCGGTTGANYAFGTNFTHVDSVINGEMLYRSTYFDGSTESKKAKKIFANNQLWLILAEDGFIYRWGTEDTYKNGFSGKGSNFFNSSICTEVTTRKCSSGDIRGNGKKCHKGYWYDEITTTCTSSTNTSKVPEKITENVGGVKFTDISYVFGDGYKKIGALTSTKEIYLWGIDTQITNNMSCTEVSGMNLCEPTKVSTSTSNLTKDLLFESIKGGVRAFIALATDGKYYKIEQPKNSKIQVTEIKSSNISLPSDILSLDLTANGTAVYVSADNKLTSDYFSTSAFDTTFRDTINGMNWKSIKVLDDTNAMCGLNADNQLYCWGIQSYTNATNQEENTYMLPVFNTNLYDSTKDYMVVEGGTTSTLTSMTSGTTWLSNGKFNIKYPTYIGGFNYEFIFK